MHILLGSITATGHMTPTLRLGKGLLSQGHRVTLLTSKGWVEGQNGAAGRSKSDVEGMRVVSMDDTMSDNIGADLTRLGKEYGLKLPRSLVRKYLAIQDEAIVAPLTRLHAEDPIDYAVIEYFSVSWMKQLTSMEIDFCVHLTTPGSFLWLSRVEGTEDWSWMTLAKRAEFFMLYHLVFGPMVDQRRILAGGKPWLIDSFPEADNFVAIPSHCKYCGSLVGTTVRLDLQGEFAAFFKRAQDAERPIICVSLGSMVRPDAVIVKAIYNGLLGGPWLVVWSLYQGGIDMLPSVDDKQFLLCTWIPQAAILAHPQCKLFLTHGGWGGLLEAASFGKPVLCLPFFGDQPGNASLAERTGWGLALTDQKADPVESVKEPPTWTGNLKSDEVHTKAAQILKTASFPEAAQRMKEGALRYGGQTGAAKQVEEWANLSRRGCLPKPLKAQPVFWLASCCAALCS